MGSANALQYFFYPRKAFSVTELKRKKLKEILVWEWGKGRMCVFYCLFCTMTNKCTTNWEIIILLLNVSTLLYHPQGTHRFTLLSYTSMSVQSLAT
jgi:hypothetical protein